MVSEADAHAPPVVIYDANLLYPFHIRNLLVQLGVHRYVSPRWTDEIHDEWIGNLVAAGRATRERLLRTRDIMKRVLPDADIRNYQRNIENLTLPDMNDRHVLAAAIEAKAEIILTFNLKDFPSAELARYRVVVTGPDAFLTQLYADDPEGIEDVVEAARSNLSDTSPAPGRFLDVLERQQLVNFVSALRAGRIQPS